MKSELERLQSQIEVLQRKVRYLAAGCIGFLALATVVALWGSVRADSSPQSLTVKRLAVVDNKGVERVVVAAPLPDPIMHGKRFKREGKISGILIYDSKGNERGGYVTNDGESSGAFLSLDSEDGQVFTAYANASGKDGATVSLQSDKRDSIDLTTYGQPRIQMAQNGKVIWKILETAPDLK